MTQACLICVSTGKNAFQGKKVTCFLLKMCCSSRWQEPCGLGYMGMQHVQLLAMGVHCMAAVFQMFQNMLHLHGATIMLGVIVVHKDAKTLDSILCLVAAKVYKKVPNLLLTADSYYLPSVRYINDLAAEFPLSAHTVVRSLAELHRAHTQIVQSLLKTPADSRQSVASTVATGEAPASAAADEAGATATPSSSSAVPSVNTAVPPATADANASAIPLSSSTPITHSFFDLTATTRADFFLWPHPTPAAWKDIQTVALRAFVTLGWFGNSKVQARLDQQEKGPKSHDYQAYREELIVLVHQLLVGHIMDPHLDMQQVVRSAVIQGTPYEHIADGAVPLVKMLHARL